MKSSFSSTDMTADFSSADGGAATDVLKQIDALNARLNALNAEAKTVRAKYDALSWVDSAAVKRGFHGVPRTLYTGLGVNQNDCEGTGMGSFCYSSLSEQKYQKAKTDRAVAKSRIDSIQSEVDGIMKQLDQLGSTNPQVIEAKAKAEATAESIKSQGESKSKVIKIVGYTAAAVIILLAVAAVIVKVRKGKGK